MMEAEIRLWTRERAGQTAVDGRAGHVAMSSNGESLSRALVEALRA
jgi:hypothetical protein